MGRKSLPTLLLLSACMQLSAQLNLAPAEILATPDAPRSLDVADMNGDGYVDVLCNCQDGAKWYPNLGNGNFAVGQSIPAGGPWLSDLYAADIDGDGDMDVLSASSVSDEVEWHENAFGDGLTFYTHLINSGVDGAVRVRAADIDGDGDLDVVSNAREDNALLWHENLGSTWAGYEIISMAALGTSGIHLADMDGDGDPDLLSASQDGDRTAWYENLGGTFGGIFTSQQVLSDSSDGAIDVYAADLDDDGDQDVIAAARNHIYVYENLGAASFGAPQIIGFADGGRDVLTADLDGDGDYDIIGASVHNDKVAFNMNLMGGCRFPAFRNAEAGSSTVDLDWQAELSNNKFEVSGRVLGSGSFQAIRTDSLALIVNGLSPDQQYEWRIRARCLDGSISDYSPLDTFATAMLPLKLEASRTLLAEAGRIPVSELVSGEILVSDLNGRVWYSGDTESIGGAGISSENWPAGQYIMHIRPAFEAPAVYRVLIQDQ